MKKGLIIVGGIVLGTAILSVTSATIGFLTGAIFTDRVIANEFKKRTKPASYRKYYNKNLDYNKAASYQKYHAYGPIYAKTSFRVRSYTEATKVLRELEKEIQKYGYASVADLYSLLGSSSNYRDCKYGWTEMTGITITAAGYGEYDINVPKAKLID